jgi:hypothetical protein
VGTGAGRSCDVVVIGAGLAGLVAARSLVEHGLTVTLLDEGTSPGGRLATYRLGAAVLDHGAQFFTVRSDEFAGLVERWRARGVPVSVWSRGFTQAHDIRSGPQGITGIGGDGYPRYTVDGGMRTLAVALSAGLTVRVRHRVRAVRRAGAGWHLAVTGARDAPDAAALVCTPPVPRTLALLDRGGVTLPASTAASLREVAYDPCLALLTVLDRDPGLLAPGGIQFAHGPVRWLADNARKKVSPRPAVTVHATGQWSRTWYNAGDTAVAGRLLDWLRPWLGDARVTATHVTRWRHAQPRDVVAAPTMGADVDGAAIAFAGDAFGHPRMEGAARSGLAAAAALIAALD